MESEKIQNSNLSKDYNSEYVKTKLSFCIEKLTEFRDNLKSTDPGVLEQFRNNISPVLESIFKTIENATGYKFSLSHFYNKIVPDLFHTENTPSTVLESRIAELEEEI